MLSRGVLVKVWGTQPSSLPFSIMPWEHASASLIIKRLAEN